MDGFGEMIHPTPGLRASTYGSGETMQPTALTGPHGAARDGLGPCWDLDPHGTRPTLVHGDHGPPFAPHSGLTPLLLQAAPINHWDKNLHLDSIFRELQSVGFFHHRSINQPDQVPSVPGTGKGHYQGRATRSRGAPVLAPALHVTPGTAQPPCTPVSSSESW